MARAFLRVVSCLCLLAMASLPARAQSQATGGAIGGTVTDESGAVVPGASVTIHNEATGLTRELTTDTAGAYRALLLPVGRYDVTVWLTGFATIRRPDLKLELGQTLTADVRLTLAKAQETVVVTGDAPLVDTTRSQQSSSVGERAVANLPVNGRNFIDFVLTTPGVTRDVRTGDISFAGQRGTLNSLVIDGADNNNSFFGQTLGRTGSGRAPYQFSQDAVQEFQVNRNAYSAEYGRAGGAVINVVTRSGSNELHGSAFEFFRDKDLNGNSYANKTANPIHERSPFRIHQFGASLGGPIVKDKAFFFLSYDGQRQTLPNEIVLTLPPDSTDPATAAGNARIRAKAGNYERTFNQDVFLARVDYQLDPRHRVTLRYNHQGFTGGNLENSGPTSALEHTGNSLVKTDTVNASLASVFSPTFYNELRVQYARDSEPGQANSNDPEVTVRQGGSTLLVFGRNFFSPRETTIGRFQIADSVTWIRGSHTVKLGADYIHDSILNFFPGNFGGRYTFNSVASFSRGVPNGSGENYIQAFAGAGTTGAETHPDINEIAFFLQDEWKAAKSLTLSYGVRYDAQLFAQPPVRNPDAQLAAAGIDTSYVPNDTANLGPRLGIAWNPEPRTVLRAGYGIFYGRTPSIMVGTAHSNNAINVQTYTFTGAAVPTYPAVFSAVPSGVAAGKPSIAFFDPAFQNPLVHQASAGIEQGLSDDIALSLSYQFVAGRELPRSRDFNVGTPVATQVPIQGGGSLTVQRFPSARPFTSFDRIIRYESTAESNYNGVTLELKKRFGGSLQATLAYTLGKVTDTVPDATAVVLGGSDDAKFASNPADFEVDRAAGSNDVRHRLVFSGYWDINYLKDSSGAVKALLNDWSLGWIATLQSGLPYSEVVTNDLNNDGNRNNDIVPGSRNAHRLPNTFNIDLRLTRRIPLGDRLNLELIGEAFNLLNSTLISGQRSTLYNFTSNLLVPQQNLSNPRLNFGVDQSAPDARVVQLAAKITF